MQAQLQAKQLSMFPKAFLFDEPKGKKKDTERKKMTFTVLRLRWMKVMKLNIMSMSMKTVPWKPTVFGLGTPRSLKLHGPRGQIVPTGKHYTYLI